MHFHQTPFMSWMFPNPKHNEYNQTGYFHVRLELEDEESFYHGFLRDMQSLVDRDSVSI